MTEQKKYIENGDMVRVIKGLDKDGPEWNGYYNPCEEFDGTKKVEGGSGNSRHLDDGYIYPVAVLEIVKKADGTVPVTDNTNSERESNMKTQEIYSYVASVNKNVMSAETNLIERTKKDVIVSGVLGADDSDNAKLQVMALVLAARPDVDTTEVQVLVRPFCG